MRAFALLLLLGTVVYLGMTMTPTHHASRYGTALAPSTAYAQDDGEVIPLPIPKPRPDPCGKVCLSSNGVKFCGYGSGIKGCNNVVLNNCIYNICI